MMKAGICAFRANSRWRSDLAVGWPLTHFTAEAADTVAKMNLGPCRFRASIALIKVGLISSASGQRANSKKRICAAHGVTGRAGEQSLLGWWIMPTHTSRAKGAAPQPDERLAAERALIGTARASVLGASLMPSICRIMLS